MDRASASGPSDARRLVLTAKSDATAFADLPSEAFTELSKAVRAIESALDEFVRYERLNYLMLMMVDPNVHFHVLPRCSELRTWGGVQFVMQAGRAHRALIQP